MNVTIETADYTLAGAKITGPNGGQIDCSELVFRGNCHDINKVELTIPLATLKAKAEADLTVVDLDGRQYVLIDRKEWEEVTAIVSRRLEELQQQEGIAE